MYLEMAVLWGPEGGTWTLEVIEVPSADPSMSYAELDELGRSYMMNDPKWDNEPIAGFYLFNENVDWMDEEQNKMKAPRYTLEEIAEDLRAGFDDLDLIAADIEAWDQLSTKLYQSALATVENPDNGDAIDQLALAVRDYGKATS